MNRPLKSRRAQGLPEYGLMLVLVVVLIVAALPVFGDAVSKLYCHINGQLQSTIGMAGECNPISGPGATPTPGGTLPPTGLTDMSIAPIYATSDISDPVGAAFQAEGFDINGNSLGDITASTTFTITTLNGPGGGSCLANICNSTSAGQYRIDATDGSVSSGNWAQLTVKDCFVAGCLVISPVNPLPGSPITVTGDGFCPNTSVQALWDGVAIGDPVNADSYGDVSITFTPTEAQSLLDSTHHTSFQGTKECTSPPVATVDQPVAISAVGGTLIDNFNRADAYAPGGTTPASGYSWQATPGGAGFKIVNHQFMGMTGSDNNYNSEMLAAPLAFPFRLNVDITGGLDAQDGSTGFWTGVSLNGGYKIKIGYHDTNFTPLPPTCYNDSSNTFFFLEDKSGNVVSCSSVTLESVPTNLNMVVTAASATALGMTLSLPFGFTAANNPTFGSDSGGGGSVSFDNLYISGDLYGQVPSQPA
jgi:hypothetical protein